MTEAEQLLSIQRALLGSVRADLRAVIIDVSTSNEYYVKFGLDHEPSDDDIDFYYVVATEFCADIPFDSQTKFKEEVVFSESNFNQMITKNQRFGYCRFES